MRALTTNPEIPLAEQRKTLRASMLVQRQLIAGRLGTGTGADQCYPRSLTMRFLMLLIRTRFLRS